MEYAIRDLMKLKLNFLDYNKLKQKQELGFSGKSMMSFFYDFFASSEIQNLIKNNTIQFSISSFTLTHLS